MRGGDLKAWSITDGRQKRLARLAFSSAAKYRSLENSDIFQ